MNSLCSLCSMQFKASKGCPSPAWTHWHKSSNSLVIIVSLVGLLGSDSLKSFGLHDEILVHAQFQYLWLCEQ